jgi:hypothetical protein
MFRALAGPTRLVTVFRSVSSNHHHPYPPPPPPLRCGRRLRRRKERGHEFNKKLKGEYPAFPHQPHPINPLAPPPLLTAVYKCTPPTHCFSPLVHCAFVYTKFRRIRALPYIPLSHAEMNRQFWNFYRYTLQLFRKAIYEKQYIFRKAYGRNIVYIRCPLCKIFIDHLIIEISKSFI